jgi:hypothetical protein
LYGTKEMYWRGALENIKLSQEIYPGYVCRFYIDEDAPQNLKDSIEGDNVEKIFMKNIGGIDGMFWRFLGACDKNVDIFLCRDTDSRLSLREKAAVDEWLMSDKDLHIMRDHPTGHMEPIMGGMWGCRNQLFQKHNFKNILNNWTLRTKYGDDQLFLKNVVYRKFKNFAFEHSEYNVRYSNSIHKFPNCDDNTNHVGKIYV